MVSSQIQRPLRRFRAIWKRDYI